VVDDHVEPAPRVDRVLDDPVGAGADRDVARVLDRLAACVTYGGDRFRGALDVVDDDLGAATRQEQRMLAAEPVMRAGDGDDAAVESKFVHVAHSNAGMTSRANRSSGAVSAVPKR